jgi:hypothetical protein
MELVTFTAKTVAKTKKRAINKTQKINRIINVRRGHKTKQYGCIL